MSSYFWFLLMLPLWLISISSTSLQQLSISSIIQSPWDISPLTTLVKGGYSLGSMLLSTMYVLFLILNK